MSFKKGVLVVLTVAAVVLSGCAAANGPRSHNPPTDVIILVDEDAKGKVVVLPDTAYVDSPAQEVQWVSCLGDLKIEFDDSTMPSPPCENGKGRCRTKIGNGHKGSHKYSVSLTKPSGETKTIDPIIIVQY